jgi:hypothetical protein
METGILYVVYNESIRNRETYERLYKIGITKNSVHDRYYGLGLKMPGKFETLFAYRLEDYAKAELIIHSILKKYRENGEWFNISQKELDHIKSTCEIMGGECITEIVMQEINSYSNEDISKKPNSAVIPSHKLVNQNLNNFGNSVNPNFPYKVIMFSIYKAISGGRDPYSATRSAWIIKNDIYLDTSKYEYAVGLQDGISLGAYKINKWELVPNSRRWEFEGIEIPELMKLTWHKQIELSKGYWQRGEFFVIDFDGKGKFRGIKPNKNQWYDC